MNLTVTSTVNCFLVTFTGGDPMGIWRKDKMISFSYLGTYIVAETQSGNFHVANTAVTGCYIIDTVNGVAPSSLLDLYNKLSALMG